jgi:hypothetical protein
VINAGGAVLELLLDGSRNNIAPTDQELSAWIQAYGLTVTSVRRIDARTREVFADREFAYIIDLSTMQVVWRQQGLFTTPTIVDVGIDKILADYL